MAHDHSHSHAHGCSSSVSGATALPKKVGAHAAHAAHAVDTSDDARRRRDVLKRLYIATILCASFLIVEVVGGLWAHSLAILSDAAHLFADLASFAVAIAASYLASMPATRQHTFGLKRTESLAALFSMVSLAFVSIGLAYEAVNRLVNPPEELVQGKIMSGVASIGVLVNLALAAVLGENHVHLPGMDHSHSHDHGGGQCGSHGHSNGHDHGHGHGHSTSNRSSSNGGYEIVSYQKNAEDACDDDHHVEEGHSHGHNHHQPASDPCGSHDGAHDHGHDHVNSDNHTNNHHDHALLHDDEVFPSEEDQRNINLRAAYLHVLADLAQSVAVLIAGLFIWLRPDWYIIDPILTLFFACLVLYSTIGVLRLSISVLLEATPPNVSWRKVYEAICEVPNVEDVHDLHIWSISHGQPTLSVHCKSNDPTALREIRDRCRRFGITHATIQVQSVGGPCITCEDNPRCTTHLSDFQDDHRD